MKKRLYNILFILFSVIWFALMKYEKTRPYGWFILGFLFFSTGLFGLIRALQFDYFPKDKVTGELIDLEKEKDSEGCISYTPIYKYTFDGKQEIYRSNISSFTFKKSKHIGDTEELLISLRNPKHIRINKKAYAALEYLGGIILSIAGIVIMVIGVFQFLKEI